MVGAGTADRVWPLTGYFFLDPVPTLKGRGGGLALRRSTVSVSSALSEADAIRLVEGCEEVRQRHARTAREHGLRPGAYRRVQINSPITTIATTIQVVEPGFPSDALIEYARF